MEANASIAKRFIHPAIVVILMLLGNFVPAPAPITPLGMQVLFIFIGMLWGWCTCSMLWPGLLGVIMLGFTGYAASPEAALGLMLTNTTFVASLVTFILFAYISGTGLLDVASTWIVTRKFAAGKPWVFMTFLFLSLCVVGPFSGNPIILIILGFSFVGPLLSKMGYTKEDALPTFMMIGISLCGMLTTWPFFLPVSLYLRGTIMTALGGQMLSGLQYTICIAVPLFLMILILLFTGKFVLRIDTSKFAEGSLVLLEEIGDKKIEINSEQKHGIITLLLFCVGIILPAILPAQWMVTQLLTKAGIVGVSVVLTIAILVFTKKDGKTFGDFAEMIRGVNWDILVLIGSMMVICTAVISAETGVLTFVTAFMVPILSRMPMVVFVILLTIIMCVLSQFTMNMVLQMVFIPILAPILAAAGYNPVIAILAIYLGTQYAYLAPSGSMPAAMVFGNTEWTTKANIYKICIPWIILSVIMSIVFTLVVPNLVCGNFIP